MKYINSGLSLCIRGKKSSSSSKIVSESTSNSRSCNIDFLFCFGLLHSLKNWRKENMNIHKNKFSNEMSEKKGIGTRMYVDICIYLREIQNLLKFDKVRGIDHIGMWMMMMEMKLMEMRDTMYV
jgi:hypothetical protein